MNCYKNGSTFDHFLKSFKYKDLELSLKYANTILNKEPDTKIGSASHVLMLHKKFLEVKKYIFSSTVLLNSIKIAIKREAGYLSLHVRNWTNPDSLKVYTLTKFVQDFLPNQYANQYCDILKPTTDQRVYTITLKVDSVDFSNMIRSIKKDKSGMYKIEKVTSFRGLIT